MLGNNKCAQNLNCRSPAIAAWVLRPVTSARRDGIWKSSRAQRRNIILEENHDPTEESDDPTEERGDPTEKGVTPQRRGVTPQRTAVNRGLGGQEPVSAWRRGPGGPTGQKFA